MVRAGKGKLALVALISLISGCTSNSLSPYVPAHCHGAAAPFHTFVLEYENVPGFIFAVIDSSLGAALQRQGLVSATTEPADILVRTSLEVIEHNQPPATERDALGSNDPFHYPMAGSAERPAGDTVAPNELQRFVTHLTIDVVDQRSGRLIWTGALDRAHAIRGGETFHNEIAVLQISQALDAMFVGLTTSCE